MRCMNLISLQNNMYFSPILSIYSPVHQSSPSVQSTSPVHSLDTPDVDVHVYPSNTISQATLAELRANSLYHKLSVAPIGATM